MVGREFSACSSRQSAADESRHAAQIIGPRSAVLKLHATAGNRAVARMLRPARASSIVARCAGGCTCGGKCGHTDDELIDDLQSRLQKAVVARRMLQRDVAANVTQAGLFEGGEQVLQNLCKKLDTSTNPAQACAPPQDGHCPSGFCAPLDSKAEAIGIRDAIRTTLLAGIAIKVSPRVVGLWDDYMGSGFSVGGDSSVRDLSSAFGADFTKSPTTVDTTKFLTQELVKALEASPPAVAPGVSITVDIPTVIPAAVTAITTPDDANEMNFNIPKDIPGNLAGGIGANEASCKVGAHPSPQNDDRLVTGTAKIAGNADGSLTVEPDMTFEVHDTIDLCPGDCGTDLEQCATVIMSRLEATAVSGDIPFKVKFRAPVQAPLRIAPQPPTPPPPTPPPGPKTQLTCPRFLRPDGTPEPTLQACVENRKRLGPPARGEPVRMIQEALLALNFDLGKFGADGVYGQDTAAAVKAFKTQQKLGFEQFGDVGPGTMARLDELCPA